MIFKNQCMMLKDIDCRHIVQLAFPNMPATRAQGLEHPSSENRRFPCYDMNRPAFERKFFRAELRRLESALRRHNPKKDPVKIFDMLFDGISFDADERPGERVTVTINGEKKWFRIYSMMRRYYAPNDTYPWFDEEVVRANLTAGTPEILRQDITDRLLVEMGFPNFCAKLQSQLAAISKAIDRQAEQQTDIVAKMLRR